MGLFKKPKRVTEIYKGERELKRGVKKMTRRGYRPEEIATLEGKYRAGKGFTLGVGGAILFGPLGALGAMLGGRKKEKFTVIFVLDED